MTLVRRYGDYISSSLGPTDVKSNLRSSPYTGDLKAEVFGGGVEKVTPGTSPSSWQGHKTKGNSPS